MHVYQRMQQRNEATVACARVAWSFGLSILYAMSVHGGKQHLLDVLPTMQEAGFVAGIGVRMISGAAGLPGNRCSSPRIDSTLYLDEISDILKPCTMD